MPVCWWQFLFCSWLSLAEDICKDYFLSQLKYRICIVKAVALVETVPILERCRQEQCTLMSLCTQAAGLLRHCIPRSSPAGTFSFSVHQSVCDKKAVNVSLQICFWRENPQEVMLINKTRAVWRSVSRFTQHLPLLPHSYKYPPGKPL